MKITENSANESELTVQIKTLAIEIFKTLSLQDELREGVGIDEHSEQTRAQHTQTGRGTCPGVGL
jgi:hypothetical protein